MYYDRRGIYVSQESVKGNRGFKASQVFLNIVPSPSTDNVTTCILWMFPAGLKSRLGCPREQNPRHMIGCFSLEHPGFPKPG